MSTKGTKAKRSVVPDVPSSKFTEVAVAPKTRDRTSAHAHGSSPAGRVERGQDLREIELPQPLLLLARRLGELRPQSIELRAQLQEGQAHLLDLWE